MKTPMQQLIEQINELKLENINEEAWGAYDAAMDIAESLLEEEREMIMDAYEAGSHTDWSEDTWMLVEKQEYYNETFNTKEK